jgi:hypothetical protein
MEARAMLGIDMYARGEFLEALKAVRPWAEQGHSSGMVLIASMYYQGRGVAKDNINAYMWAELGVIYAKDDEEYDKAITFRNEITPHMTEEDIDEAHRLTKDWQPGKPLPPEEKTEGAPDGKKTGDEEMPVGEEI